MFSNAFWCTLVQKSFPRGTTLLLQNCNTTIVLVSFMLLNASDEHSFPKPFPLRNNFWNHKKLLSTFAPRERVSNEQNTITKISTARTNCKHNYSAKYFYTTNFLKFFLEPFFFKIFLFFPAESSLRLLRIMAALFTIHWSYFTKKPFIVVTIFCDGGRRRRKFLPFQSLKFHQSSINVITHIPISILLICQLI